MKIHKFKSTFFRNLNIKEFIPTDNVNIIHGENAQGKTNLIEGIYLFSGNKSFRGAKDSELVEFENEKAKLELEFFSHGREQSAEIIIDGRRNTYLNGVKLKNSTSLADNIHIIVFSPDLLSIIKEGPKERRKFLNVAIGGVFPTYNDVLKKYNHILMQRNAVLKNYKNNKTLYDVLDEYDKILSVYGEKIISIRLRYLQKLMEYLPNIYKDLTKEKEIIEVEYKLCDLQDGTKEELYEKLKEVRPRDIALSSTTIGPHRDDIVFNINGINAKAYGSQGQQRSIVLALKLAEAEMIKEICGEQPIALLDDVMSELDVNRQDYILNHTKNWQVFITCCDPSSIERLKKGKTFLIENGKIKNVSGE